MCDRQGQRSKSANSLDARGVPRSGGGCQFCFFFQAEDGIRDVAVTGVQTCALPICKGLWVNTFMDGTTHYFDLTDPEHPKETYQRRIGTQVNMISQSWDGKRVYMTSSLQIGRASCRERV